MCYLCDSCHSHGFGMESRVSVRAVAPSLFPWALTGVMSVLCRYPTSFADTLHSASQLSLDLCPPWQCSVVFHVLLGRYLSTLCSHSLWWDSAPTLPPLIYYLPMSNTVKIIRALSVLVHKVLTDSTLWNSENQSCFQILQWIKKLVSQH